MHVAPASVWTQLAHHELALSRTLADAGTARQAVAFILSAGHQEAFFLWVQLLRKTGDLVGLPQLLCALESVQVAEPSTLVGIAEMLVDLDGGPKHLEIAQRLVLRVTSDSLPPANVYAAIFDFRRSNRRDVAAAELLKSSWPWPCCQTRSGRWYASRVYGLGFHYAQLGDDIVTILAKTISMCSEHRERLGAMAAWLRRHRQVCTSNCFFCVRCGWLTFLILSDCAGHVWLSWW